MNRVAVAQLAGVFGVRGAFKCRPTPAGEGTLRVGGSYALAQVGDGRRLDFRPGASGQETYAVLGSDQLDLTTGRSTPWVWIHSSGHRIL